MSIPDPILAAIKAAAAARAHHIAALVDLDESDEAEMSRANQAADRDTAAWQALAAVTPTTVAGLRALLRYLAECFELDEPTSMAGEHFGLLAAALDPCDGNLILSDRGRKAA